MGLWGSIISVIGRPFPEESNKTVILINAIIGLFVVFCLYVFQPFGISELESNIFLTCLGFGIAGFLSAIFYEFAIAPLFGLKYAGNSMNFGKWNLYMLGILIMVSLGNFLYARIIIFGYIEWQFFPAMVYGTLMIGFFPIILLGWFALKRKEKIYQNIALELNVNKVENLELSDGQHPIFDIAAHQIRYIQAFQNYVRIGHVNEEGMTKELTERATLKSIVDEVEGSMLVRCHRSYIVNRNAILSTSGNAQGLMLTLSECDKQIPVSRSFVPTFRGL